MMPKAMFANLYWFVYNCIIYHKRCRVWFATGRIILPAGAANQAPHKIEGLQRRLKLLRRSLHVSWTGIYIVTCLKANTINRHASGCKSSEPRMSLWYTSCIHGLPRKAIKVFETEIVGQCVILGLGGFA